MHHQIDHHHDGGAAHGARGEPGNSRAPTLVEAAVEVAEEAVDRPLPPAVAVLADRAA